jgi:hypothetical protein
MNNIMEPFGAGSATPENDEAPTVASGQGFQKGTQDNHRNSLSFHPAGQALPVIAARPHIATLRDFCEVNGAVQGVHHA